MAAMITKSYADRLRAAIAKSDAHPDPEQAVFIMKQALEREIKQVDALTNMSGFQAWLCGERFEDVAVRGRKK